MSMQPLSIELKAKAKQELNEVEYRIPEDIEHIREWLKKQSHLNYKNDDNWILSFLRGCKFSLEKTKFKLDYYYTMKSLLPDIFTNWDPFDEEIRHLLNAGVCMVLPRTQYPSSPRIFLCQWNNFNRKEISCMALIKLFFMGYDETINEDNHSMICGIYLVADLRNLPNNLITQYTPLLLKKLMLCLQYGYPIRVKGMHFINAPPLMENVFNICKPFLTEKIKSRVHIYSQTNIQKFYEVIPQHLMPVEYGGNNGSLLDLTEISKVKYESYRNWFSEHEKYRSNEKLRTGKPKTFDEEFGVDGSFRKLAYD